MPPAVAPGDLDRIGRASSALYTPVRRPNRWALPTAIGATAVVLLLIVLLFVSGPKRGGARPPALPHAPQGGRGTAAPQKPAPVRGARAEQSPEQATTRPGQPTQRPGPKPTQETYSQGPRFVALDDVLSRHITRVTGALFRDALRDDRVGVRHISGGTRLVTHVDGRRYEARAMSEVAVSVSPEGSYSSMNWHILTLNEWPFAGRYGLPPQTHIYCRRGALAVADWSY